LDPKKNDAHYLSYQVILRLNKMIIEYNLN